MFDGRMKGAHVTGMVACAPFFAQREVSNEEHGICRDANVKKT